MKIIPTVLSAALFAAPWCDQPCGRCRDREDRQPGRRIVAGPALAERVAAAHRAGERLRGAGRPRDANYKLTPGLATSWKQTSPTVWHFELRKNVQFHDGTPFTADDVIFSYERAKGDGSDMKTYVGRHQGNRKINDHSIDIDTTAPFPDPAGPVLSLVHHEQEVVRGQPGDAAGRPAQGHRERRLVPCQRHRPVPRARAPAERAHDVRAQRQLLGQDRRQRGRGHLQRDRQRRDSRGRAAVRRGRRDGAGAGAGHRPHQGRAQPQGACRAPSCA